MHRCDSVSYIAASLRHCLWAVGRLCRRRCHIWRRPAQPSVGRALDDRKPYWRRAGTGRPLANSPATKRYIYSNSTSRDATPFVRSICLSRQMMTATYY